ncbi:MAG: DsbA family protein, partial [Pseudomonadaceae bacterium]
QGKFWEMDSWLFAHVAGKGFVSARPAAELLGLDLEAFDTCLDDDETWAWAAAEANAARKARVIDTPT